MANKIGFHVRDFIDLGVDFVSCKVISSTGSTPRKKGALMLVSDKKTIGTVGGGKIEFETEKLAKKALEEKIESQIFHFVLDESEEGIGMACGGDADILIEYIDVKNHPEKFVMPEEKPSTAYIFGAGHVGLEIEKVLRYVDFKTVVIDDREDYANKMRFPKADEVIVIDDFTHSFEKIKTDENSYIFIVTRGHMGDLDVLRDAVKAPCAYLGMIGSRKKNKVLYERLKEEGVDEKEFERIYSPIGLDIKAETPEEIAIAVAGEVIKVRAENGQK